MGPKWTALLADLSVCFDRFGNVELAFQCKTTRRIPVPIDWLVGELRADMDWHIM